MADLTLPACVLLAAILLPADASAGYSLRTRLNLPQTSSFYSKNRAGSPRSESPFSPRARLLTRERNGVKCKVSLRQAEEKGIPLGEGRKGRHKNRNRVPNNHWRAVPWEDLRKHPYVDALPPPWEVEINTAADLAKLRRDSRRFLRVHHGRVTTFQLPTLLGFFEEGAADYLKIRRPFRGRHDKILGTRQDLIQSGAYDMNKNLDSYITLAKSLSFMDEELEEEFKISQDNQPNAPLWLPHSDENSEYARVFASMYSPIPRAPKGEMDPDLDLSVRYGEAQQATGVLTALNVLSQEGARIKECGLYALEAIKDAPSFPFPVGTVPDAMISWPDGREEPLVIKTATPFEVYKGTDGFLRTRLDANSRPSKHIENWHIPQMQLHMLCTGAKSSWVLYMSGLNGARLYRIDRDDGYIKQMAGWVTKFAQLYGRRSPSPNFFLTDNYDEYRSFLAKTRRISKDAFEFALIKQKWIQRSTQNTPFFVGDFARDENSDYEGDQSHYNMEVDFQNNAVERKMRKSQPEIAEVEL